MKSTAIGLTRALTAITGGLVFLSAGCDQAALDKGQNETNQATAGTEISWNDSSSETRSTQITAAQAEWLKSARQRARERLKAGLPAIRETPPGMTSSGNQLSVSSALVLGSGDWADCQFLDWFLVTSGSDFTGTIFCARLSNSGMRAILIGGGNSFVPKWFDSATDATDVNFNICNSSQNCQITDCCGNGSCSSIWRSFFSTSGTGNISPPFNVDVIAAQIGHIVC